MGLFMPAMHENEEMTYQLLYDYRFDSSKIEAACGLQASSSRDGIRRSLAPASGN